MKYLLLSFLIMACSKDPQQQTDAGVRLVDAKLVDAKPDARPDAPPDASPDAPNMNVVTACMHACDAIGVCVGQQVPPDCYTGCADDLADCSADQVTAVDACSTEACGDLENDSPLLTCISGVTCVDMALARPRSR